MSFEAKCIKEFGMSPNMIKGMLKGNPGKYCQGFLDGYKLAQEEFLRILQSELKKMEDKNEGLL